MPWGILRNCKFLPQPMGQWSRIGFILPLGESEGRVLWVEPGALPPCCCCCRCQGSCGSGLCPPLQPLWGSRAPLHLCTPQGLRNRAGNPKFSSLASGCQEPTHSWVLSLQGYKQSTLRDILHPSCEIGHFIPRVNISWFIHKFRTQDWKNACNQKPRALLLGYGRSSS